MKVMIAGGGIGGLTLALSLHQAGCHDVRVFEAAKAFAPLGVGINILPHAFRELTELGLGDELAALGVATAELAYHNRHGQQIWSEPRGIAAGYHWPQLSVHRGTLQMKLLDAVIERLGQDAVVTGHELVSWENLPGGVRATFAGPDGAPCAEHQAALLIGADGIHSAVRAALAPGEGPPIWNGAVLWRGVTEAVPFLTGRSMIMAGHEFQKFVCYPITQPDDGGLSLINWVAERKFPVDNNWRREDWNRAAHRADFEPWFADWAFDWLDIPMLIGASEHVYEYPMVDRDPLDGWTQQRVSLLGDAAHPMYPIGSNGASQAILDARVLTGKFQEHGFSSAALLAYEAERRPATSKIVLANRGNGPEQVMQMVEERAPAGFTQLDEVITSEELDEIASNYKKIAGFDKEMLNNRESLVSLP